MPAPRVPWWLPVAFFLLALLYSMMRFEPVQPDEMDLRARAVRVFRG